MKRIFYSLLAASALFMLPACNGNGDNLNEDSADTATMPGYDDINYNDQGGATPVSADTTQGMDQSDNLPGNSTGTKDRTGNNMRGDNGTSSANSDNVSPYNNPPDANVTNTRPTSRKAGFKVSGEYDSRYGGRPKPVNTDDKYYKENPPAHSYGDTAPRIDGVNGVR